MLEGLDKVDWKRLRHAYGVATDVPDFLRRLAAATNESEFEKILSDFWNTVNHQGDIYSATVAVIPFIIQLLNHEKTFRKDYLLASLTHVVQSCSRRTTHISELKDCFETYQKVCEGRKTYIRLLHHEKKIIRYEVAQLLGSLYNHGNQIRPALVKAIYQEKNPSILAIMLHGIANLIPQDYRDSTKKLREKYAAFFLTFMNGHSEPLVRNFAAIAWVKIQRPYKAGYYKHDSESIPNGLVKILMDGYVHPVPLDEDFFTHFFLDDISNLTALDYLARFGIYTLAETLTIPSMKAEQIHEVAREMLDMSFARRSVAESWSFYQANPFIKQTRFYTLRYRGNPYNPNQSLNDHQKFVITTIVNNDLFWELPTNLFSFFYGLPDSRDELRKLIS